MGAYCLIIKVKIIIFIVEKARIGIMEITEEAALLYIHELVDPFMDFTQIELSYSIKSN